MAIQTDQSERFQRGWQRLIEVAGEGGERVVESLEAILHCIPCAGFPRVLNAIFVAKRVFEERDVDPLTDEA